ncbi:nuclear transport factor 2 family protein [Blastococcus sp. Marseille-P5729]|uniref:nuclear transport factor 2 family protein n=1 Tax=Blastococcus sp. Marseille-P5729 TaxID=2086582 RepID=UPI00131C6E08|nr:nuclear transport factor 2 family protein [Blastococcus sp. Marseille-P5729]
MNNLDLVRRYYAACYAADVEAIAGCLTDGFIHYFLAPNQGSHPREGARALAATTAKSVRLIGSQWTIDRYIEQDDRAAIEYTMTWTPRDTAIATSMRASEWFLIDDGRLSEARSYHQVTATASDLDGFDYDRRGYGGAVPAAQLAVPGDPPRPSRLPLIVAYYDACTRADAGALQSMFADDVVHYFLQPNVGSSAVGGAEHLARYWRKVARMLRARWVVESLIERGDEAVIEWSMYWEPETDRRRIVTRGTEWYVFDGDRIAEIRSYHKQARESSELDGFDYPAAGFSTAGHESSRLHDAARTPLSEPLS